MCTVSTHHDGNTLLVTMNRDEARSRGPELPPEIFRHGAISWVAPRDSERGGSWIGANSLGVVACVLNGYLPGDDAPPAPLEGFRTRGEIVPRLLKLGDAGSMRNELVAALDPTAFPSFTLLLATTESVEAYFWSGEGTLQRDRFRDNWHMVTSSSWNTGAVCAWRRRAFDRWLKSRGMRDGIPEFHLLHPEGQFQSSPLMDREFAATRSITQVEIREGTLVMRYWPRQAVDDRSSPRVVTLALDKGPVRACGFRA